MSELIDPVTGVWDEELVRTCFNPADVQVILSIPLCEQAEDFMSWHYDRKGLFSVKSAYKVHVNMMKNEARIQVGGGSESHEQAPEIFKAIWKVDCPPRVHHFFWRLAHNSHPMYMNISR